MKIDNNERKVIDCAFYALNVLTELAVYSWDGDFCKKQAIEAIDKIKTKLADFDVFKVEGEDSLNIIGVKSWDDKNRLCPLYLHHKYFPEQDNDHRFFCIASGWECKDGKILPKEKDIFSDEQESTHERDSQT